MLRFRQYQYRLDQSPTVRLLRSDNAALILGFLYDAFKSRHRLTVPQNELEAGLGDYLEMVRATHADQFLQTPAQYLNLWSDDKHRFLRRYYEVGRDEPVVELTYDCERALEWMETLEAREFVGTESRFLAIFEKLREIADKSDTDPKRRIEELRRKKKAIEDEIKRIKEDGRVDHFNETQVKERFFNILDEARRLISDFRMVEDNFKDTTRQVKEEKLLGSKAKGQILGLVLDADDALQESDQGRSFYGFWEFLRSSDKQQELAALTERVLALPEIESLISQHSAEYADHLRRLKTNLHLVGQKTLGSVHRLSEELKRLLHTESLLENKRVIALIEEIKGQALAAKGTIPARKVFINIDGGIKIELPGSRPLWSPTKATTFLDRRPSQGSDEISQTALAALVGQFHIDIAVLRQQVAMALRDRTQIKLKELVELYPVEKGLSEVMGYFQIATQDPLHMVNEAITETFTVAALDGDQHRILKIQAPQIIFGTR